MATIETALTRLLGIQHPILLAPMGAVAGGKLAAAVTHAGGLGLVAAAGAREANIRRELGEAGNARVGIGFILWMLDHPAALDGALAARPVAIMRPRGLHRPHQGGRHQDHLPAAVGRAGEAGG
jgi:nitronate monooxygenase